MSRKVFFSFHYKPDVTRVAKIRNIGAVEGNRPAADNDWETVERGGAAAIQRWIDSQLFGKSCTIVLIGEKTAGRKWINYEIAKSWSDGKGLLGIHIHNVVDLTGKSSSKGENPFSKIIVGARGGTLAPIVPVYDPPYRNSKDVYAYIGDNVEKWIERAILIRKNYY